MRISEDREGTPGAKPMTWAATYPCHAPSPADGWRRRHQGQWGQSRAASRHRHHHDPKMRSHASRQGMASHPAKSACLHSASPCVFLRQTPASFERQEDARILNLKTAVGSADGGWRRSSGGWIGRAIHLRGDVFESVGRCHFCPSIGGIGAICGQMNCRFQAESWRPVLRTYRTEAWIFRQGSRGRRGRRRRSGGSRVRRTGTSTARGRDRGSRGAWRAGRGHAPCRRPRRTRTRRSARN
jgi:hypothetical protein